MDVRIDVERALGLTRGDAHILRNAGALVTDDVERSIVVSQQLLGTRDVTVLMHTDCGAFRLDEAAIIRRLESAAGYPFPATALGAFDDIDAAVMRAVDRLRANPFLEAGSVCGCVLDVDTQRVRRVTGAMAPSRFG